MALLHYRNISNYINDTMIRSQRTFPLHILYIYGDARSGKQSLIDYLMKRLPVSCEVSFQGASGQPTGLVPGARTVVLAKPLVCEQFRVNHINAWTSKRTRAIQCSSTVAYNPQLLIFLEDHSPKSYKDVGVMSASRLDEFVNSLDTIVHCFRQRIHDPMGHHYVVVYNDEKNNEHFDQEAYIQQLEAEKLEASAQ